MQAKALPGGQLTVIVNVWVGLVSTPPLAVPPSSVRRTVMVAVPVTPLGSQERVPSAATAGAVVKMAGLLLPVTSKVTVCPASSGGPAEMPVAQPGTLCGPVGDVSDWSAPTVKTGAS